MRLMRRGEAPRNLIGGRGEHRGRGEKGRDAGIHEDAAEDRGGRRPGGMTRDRESGETARIATEG